MGKLRISRLTLEKFKGVDRLEVRLDGANAVISGENGAGKSTVADAYCWLLSGKMADGKTAEIGKFDAAGKVADEVHSVELEFTDGTILRRETNGASRFYYDGVPLKMREYFEAVTRLTGGATFLTMPQFFCQLDWKERRALLMRLGDVSDAKVIASNRELAPLKELLEKHTPEQLRRQARNEREKLTRELLTIPARIDELQRQVQESRDREDLKAAIGKLELSLKDEERLKLEKNLRELKSGAEKIAKQMEQGAQDLTRLRLEYKATQSKLVVGKCPTCGAKIAMEVQAQLLKKLVSLQNRGEEIVANQEIQKRGLAAAKSKIDELTAKMNETLADNRGELRALKAELKALESWTARIEELRQIEIRLNAKIAKYDRLIYLLELFNKAKIEQIEGAINSQFEIVRWKMFADYKVADGVRECCEPMINGVPYNGNLSKGEKLMAALDILRTLQKFYSVELPVFIDDAESFTSNSFVELPNQIIRLKAVEGVRRLKIDVAQIEEGLSA